MPASNSAAVPQSPESGVDHLVRFSFPITWTFLSQGPGLPKFESRPPRKPPALAESMEASRKEPLEPAVAAEIATERHAIPPAAVWAEVVAPAAKIHPGEPVERLAAPLFEDLNSDHAGVSAGPDRWEMVIPKMDRPMARSSRTLIEETEETAKTETDEVGPKEAKPEEIAPVVNETAPQPIAADAGHSSVDDRPLDLGATDDGPSGPASIDQSSIDHESEAEEDAQVPEFAFLERRPQQSSRKFVAIGGALAVVLVIGVLTLGSAQPSAPSPSTRPAPAADRIGAALSTEAGQWKILAESPRRISVLPDSAHLADFRMDLQIPSDAKSAGWVFRVRDSENYYAMRLEIAGTSAVLKRFLVIDGFDQPAKNIDVTAQPGAGFKVRTEARGDTLTTWIGDRKVDEWTGLTSDGGQVGLYSEFGESPADRRELSVFPLGKQ